MKVQTSPAAGRGNRQWFCRGDSSSRMVRLVRAVEGTISMRRRLFKMKWTRVFSAVLALAGMTASADAGLFGSGGCKSCGCAEDCQPACCKPTIARPCHTNVYTYQRKCSDIKPPCCDTCGDPGSSCCPVTCCAPADACGNGCNADPSCCAPAACGNGCNADPS